MNLSKYTFLLQQIATYVCYFIYSFFITSFLYIYVCNHPFLTSSMIKDYYTKYIVLSTAFDSMFLLGIFGATFVISYLLDIQSTPLQLLLTIFVSLLSVYVTFYLILPIVYYNQYSKALLNEFKRQNVYCHYTIFSIALFIVLCYFTHYLANSY